MRLAFIVLTAFLSCAAAGAVHAEQGGCLAQGCHAKMLDAKYVHGPVAVGDCQYCHKETGKHAFKTAARPPELCVICHEFKRPVKAVDCLSCHDPHGSAREFQLKAGIKGKCKK